MSVLHPQRSAQVIQSTKMSWRRSPSWWGALRTMAWAQRNRKRRTEGKQKRGNRSWLKSLLRWNKEIKLPWLRWRSSMNSGWVQRGGKADHNGKQVQLCHILTQQKNLAEVKCQEEELMEACALPLRSYLMKIVIPPLSEALLDCSKIKPEDPVDYLVLTCCRANESFRELTLN